ncbi:hypothetical protein GH714_000069 [Hevea brasiliensis]|uniref:Endoplasmic reticulum vesicle transporter C-terminal domain-containing protein n=1 Tax=Hevea brasiliensis TaxID=3981 RepID=A0A6A6M906_HEVBR|nr:hypothetical protein GH714_000069 [Hevea brasiliensis]
MRMGVGAMSRLHHCVLQVKGLYLLTVTETKLLVDTSRGETLKINFDVTFPSIPCTLLSLDAMDIMGEQHFDITYISKKRINVHGDVIEVRRDGIGAPKIEKPLQRHGGRLEHGEAYCGSCYGAEMSDDDCCNSCEQVREAYRKKGWSLTNVDLIDQISHRINRLAFGDYFPGVGTFGSMKHQNGIHQYFLKVVPTKYTDIRGHTVSSNQYSVTEHYKKSESGHFDPPGVFFFYDFSPIKVTFKEEHSSFLHFMTNICAVFGGIFTIAGIIDSFVYHGQRAIKKKAEIGKYR